MNRAERRRQEKSKAKKPTTYTFTKEGAYNVVERMVKEQIEKEKSEIMNDAVNQVMLLLFVLPMEVLMDHYWQKSYSRKIPEFTQYLMDYYADWQDGKLDMDKMKQDLWEYGGVRLEEAK